jgi:uncharacterized cofD-like protein
MARPAKEYNFTVLGGGTGLSTLLRGIKTLSADITAVVTVTDDGGSSGTLRRELGVLPPGDIRNCLVALSEEENLMSKLFQYRFPKSGSLSGHSFGNLFITAISAVSGSFDAGVTQASQVLAIRGRVLPATLRSATLKAKLEDGRVVLGESNIARTNSRITELSISPARPPAGPKVIEAIRKADAVIVGPGSLYTSLIANFLVGGVAEALKKSRAPKIYICNIMTQPGETSGYSVCDHLDAMSKYLGGNIFDYIVLNTGGIPPDIEKRYAKQNSFKVRTDLPACSGSKIIRTDLVSKKEYARHDSAKLARVIQKIMDMK